jgi:hypothetical protein
MPIHRDHLDDFINAYENAFNEQLTPDQAHELFDRLLDLYSRIKRVSDRMKGGPDSDGTETVES